jgi:cobalt/nickel transport system permease protein
MDIGLIDYYANSGESFLHRASAMQKIIFVIFILASVVVTKDLLLLMSIYLVLVALVILTRLPFFKIISIAAYPAVFGLLFAAASWNGSWIRSGVIVLKTVSAALSMVLLIVTTPYPRVFAAMNPFLPKVVVEGLFLTYRSLFILLELTGNLVRALRVRGGLSPRRYIRNITNFSSGIGLLVIRGLDLSEKFYGVMKIRGYSGKMVEDRKMEFGRKTFMPAVAGFLVFALSVALSFENDFSRYHFFVFGVSLLFVVVATSYVYFYEDRGLFWKN